MQITSVHGLAISRPAAKQLKKVIHGNWLDYDDRIANDIYDYGNGNLLFDRVHMYDGQIPIKIIQEETTLKIVWNQKLFSYLVISPSSDEEYNALSLLIRSIHEPQHTKMYKIMDLILRFQKLLKSNGIKRKAVVTYKRDLNEIDLKFITSYYRSLMNQLKKESRNIATPSKVIIDSSYHPRGGAGMFNSNMVRREFVERSF